MLIFFSIKKKKQIRKLGVEIGEMADARKKVPQAISPSRLRSHLWAWEGHKGLRVHSSQFTDRKGKPREVKDLLKATKCMGSISISKLALELRDGSAPWCHMASAGHGGLEGAHGCD